VARHGDLGVAFCLGVLAAPGHGPQAYIGDLEVGAAKRLELHEEFPCDGLKSGRCRTLDQVALVWKCSSVICRWMGLSTGRMSEIHGFARRRQKTVTDCRGGVEVWALTPYIALTPRRKAALFDAGWSSPVARQAHNLKV